MLDAGPGDGVSPQRWRSSIAIFDYQPGEDDQNHDGMIISYLKVACTLTGYQVDAAEIGVARNGSRSYWKDKPGIEDYTSKLASYFACFGAVLEVTLRPKNPDTPRREIPYFLDFEPKKREMYQLASDTNERQSRSIEDVNATKSAGNTQSLETYDIDMGGGGFGANASFAGTGGGFTYTAPNGQWGTKKINSDQTMISRSDTVGDEKRETYSFSTQISQLYHQLDSYHLGTNRALFFVLPRPHTLETERTFVNGIRNIEGIQEFFLVVARPKDQEGFCVEAYLETGHIGKVARNETEEIVGSELTTSWTDAFHAQPKGDDDETTVYDDRDRQWVADTLYPGQGYKIKSAVLTSTGPEERSNKNEHPHLVDTAPFISKQTPDYLVVSGKVHSGFANYGPGSEDRWEQVTYPFVVSITLVKTRAVQRSTDTLFMTARNLNCCAPNNFKVVDGTRIHFEYDLKPAQATRGRQSTQLDFSHAQHVALQEGLRASASSPLGRYEEGLTLAQTNFAARLLASEVPEVEPVPIHRLAGLTRELRKKLSRLRDSATVGDLLGMPVQMQQDVLGLSFAEVMELRGVLTGATHVNRDPADAWLSSDQKSRLFLDPKEDERPSRETPDQSLR